MEEETTSNRTKGMMNGILHFAKYLLQVSVVSSSPSAR